MDNFSKACQVFSLTINLSNANVRDKGVDKPSAIKINKYDLKLIHEFIYHVSTVQRPYL